MSTKKSDILIDMLDNNKDPYIRQAIAFHEDADEDVLMNAVSDANYMVRLYAIHNPNSTIKVLNAAANVERPEGSKQTVEQKFETEAIRARLSELLRAGPKLYSSEWRVNAFKLFTEKFGNPHAVLYPSCDTDTSPAKAFTNVTFVDVEEKPIAALQKEGFSAIATDIRTLQKGQEFDLLILLNPGTPPEWATQYLMTGGYVIANDYHKTASDLFKNKEEFALVGVIHSLGGEESKPTFESAGIRTKIEGVDDLYVFRKL